MPQTYAVRPMRDITANEYWALSLHIQAQVMSALKQDVLDDAELWKTVSEIVTQEWYPDRTSTEWRERVADRLGVDVSECVCA